MSIRMHIHRPAHTQGFTLVELACTLAVLLVLLEGSLSLFGKLLPHERLVSDTNQVLSLLTEARNLALRQQSVMVCSAHSDCSHFTDSQGLMLVIDSNHNFRRDSTEKVVTHLTLQPGTHISWHSFRNLPNLTYLHNGKSYFQNGHLLLCTDSRASKVVVNRIGRPHIELLDDNSLCRQQH